MLIIYVFRGGKICLTDHFKPLWARNVPKFGIAHAMALGVRYQKDYVCVLVVVGGGGAMALGVRYQKDYVCVLVVVWWGWGCSV